MAVQAFMVRFVLRSPRGFRKHLGERRHLMLIVQTARSRPVMHSVQVHTRSALTAVQAFVIHFVLGRPRGFRKLLGEQRHLSMLTWCALISTLPSFTPPSVGSLDARSDFIDIPTELFSYAESVLPANVGTSKVVTP